MAIRFDASGDSLTRAQISSGAHTFMGWFKITTDRNNYSVFFQWNGNVALETGADGTTLELWTNPTSVAGSALTVGTWYHLALTTSNIASGTGVTKAYVNGVLDITGNGAAAGVEIMYVGNDSLSEFLNGCFAYGKSWTAELTAAEILQEMKVIRPVRMTNLSGWYPTWDATSIRNLDFSGNALNFTANGTLTDEAPPGVTWGARLSYMPVVVAGGTTYNATATLAGTSSAVTVGKNTIPFTSTLAGTSSAVTVGKNTIPYTATLAGTSSAVTVGKNTIPYTATLAGTSSAVTVAKNTIPYTATLAGTSSLVIVGQITGQVQFTATLAGTSSAVTVGKKTNPFTSTLAGTSSAVTVGKNTIPYTSTLAGTSSLVVVGQITGQVQFTSTLAGTSSLIPVAKKTNPFTSTLAGTSSVVTVAKNINSYTSTLAGTSSLVTVGKKTNPFTSTLAGTSSAVTVTRITIPYTSTLAGTSSLVIVGQINYQNVSYDEGSIFEINYREKRMSAVFRSKVVEVIYPEKRK
jgi:hypothetical protein